MTGEQMIALEIIKMVFSLLVLLIAFVVISELCKLRKTKEYRVELSDMYVAAKIRKIADGEGIKLSEEYENFKKWKKARKMDSNSYGFDDVVEEELIEKVQKDNERVMQY